MGELIMALEAGDKHTRTKIAKTLGVLKDKRATEALIKALDDEDNQFRHEAMFARARM